MPDVPDELLRAAKEAFAGRPPSADGVFALDTGRNPWRALDDALAVVLDRHEAMVRDGLLDSASAEMERFFEQRERRTQFEAASLMSLSANRAEAYEETRKRLAAAERRQVAEEARRYADQAPGSGERAILLWFADKITAGDSDA